LWPVVPIDGGAIGGGQTNGVVQILDADGDAVEDESIICTSLS
jgi:hypothetical protein